MAYLSRWILCILTDWKWGLNLKLNGVIIYMIFGDRRLAPLLIGLLKIINQKAIVNLASVEYFSVLKNKEIDLPVINPVFKDFKNGDYKIISFFAKKARERWLDLLFKIR